MLTVVVACFYFAHFCFALSQFNTMSTVSLDQGEDLISPPNYLLVFFCSKLFAVLIHFSSASWLMRTLLSFCSFGVTYISLRNLLWIALITKQSAISKQQSLFVFRGYSSLTNLNLDPIPESCFLPTVCVCHS